MKMQVKLSALALLLSLPFLGQAQRLFTRSANVAFDATTNSSLEVVDAKTNTGTLVIDVPTGKVEAAVLMKSFLFEKALMQEHFNENYVESTKYPKAVFKGAIDDASKVDFKKDGTYKTNISGDLTMHGVTKKVTAPATFTVKGGKVSAQSDFKVLLKDYNISIPSVVSDKVAKEVKVSFGGDLEVLK
jgi:polyisoprenoid-binding protein YceI